MMEGKRMNYRIKMLTSAIVTLVALLAVACGSSDSSRLTETRSGFKLRSSCRGQIRVRPGS